MTKAEEFFRPHQGPPRRNFAYAPFYSFPVTWSNYFFKSHLDAAVGARKWIKNSELSVIYIDRPDDGGIRRNAIQKRQKRTPNDHDLSQEDEQCQWLMDIASVKQRPDSPLRT